MSEEEIALLELLRSVNMLERRCQQLGKATTPIPKTVYVMLGSMRDQLARWGTSEVVQERV
jgi:hypothetical protein